MVMVSVHESVQNDTIEAYPLQFLVKKWAMVWRTWREWRARATKGARGMCARNARGQRWGSFGLYNVYDSSIN